MKIMISNRLNDLPNETLENIDINLSAFILALGETPETQRSKLSCVIHKSKALDSDKLTQMLVLNQYTHPKSIDTKKIYSGRLHSVSLTGTLHWEVLQIDETSYLKHRAKNPAFLPNLIKQHSKIKSTLSAPLMPEFMMEPPLLSKKTNLLRPHDEVNLAYPIPPAPSCALTRKPGRPGAVSLPEVLETPKKHPQKTKKYTKKIMFLSLVMGMGAGAMALLLFNFSLIASILYAALASTSTFIIAKYTLNKPPKSTLPPSPIAKLEVEEEGMQAQKPVNPLLTPKNTRETADKKMPPKPILSVRDLTKKPATIFENPEDSEDSEASNDADNSEKLAEMDPKRSSKSSLTHK